MQTLSEKIGNQHLRKLQKPERQSQQPNQVLDYLPEQLGIQSDTGEYRHIQALTNPRQTGMIYFCR